MAAADTPPPADAPPHPAVTSTSQTINSTLSQALLAAVLVIAYIEKNSDLVAILGGVIAANATTIINYIFGSSESSQRKDAIISKHLLPPASPPTQ